MRMLSSRTAGSPGTAGAVLGTISATVVLLWLLLGLGALVTWVQPPPRRSTGPVALGDYGAPGVSLRISYPTRIRPDPAGADAGVVVVSAVADGPDAVRPLAIALPLEGDAVLFLDGEGRVAPGRLEIVPGYPDPLPHSLRIAHGNTQLRGGVLRSYRVQITPVLLLDEGPVEVPPLALSVSLPSRAADWVWTALSSLNAAAAPYLAVVTVGVVGVWLVVYSVQRRAEAEQRTLMGLYRRLEEHIRLERWSDAREAIESIRLIEPGYRDVQLLDTRVRSADNARWRREELFRSGVTAYREGRWREAARALADVAREDPFFRDVHFLSRTAALYTDLSSRDRSRRVAAARQLGEVGDLVEWGPLLDALADPSPEVAEAAERAFQQIGPGAFEVLLGALTHASEEIRRRSFRVIKGYSSAVKEELLAALRSSDVHLTRQVAQLLHAAGGRRELAEALLWAEDGHLPGVVEPLLGEGIAATSLLIDVLLRAPDDRVEVVLRAVAALKDRADITRPLDEAYRAHRDHDERQRLERAVEVGPAPFMAAAEAAPAGPPEDTEPEALPSSEDAETDATEPRQDAVEVVRRRITRLFDRQAP